MFDSEALAAAAAEWHESSAATTAGSNPIMNRVDVIVAFWLGLRALSSASISVRPQITQKSYLYINVHLIILRIDSIHGVFVSYHCRLALNQCSGRTG